MHMAIVDCLGCTPGGGVSSEHALLGFPEIWSRRGIKSSIIAFAHLLGEIRLPYCFACTESNWE
jgi:hypothetical protein